MWFGLGRVLWCCRWWGGLLLRRGLSGMGCDFFFLFSLPRGVVGRLLVTACTCIVYSDKIYTTGNGYHNRVRVYILTCTCTIARKLGRDRI